MRQLVNRGSTAVLGLIGLLLMAAACGENAGSSDQATFEETSSPDPTASTPGVTAADTIPQAQASTVPPPATDSSTASAPEPTSAAPTGSMPDDYAWALAIQMASEKLGIIAQSNSGDSGSSDLNPVDRDDRQCPFGDFGDHWFAEAGGTVVCASASTGSIIAASIDSIGLTDLEDLAGGPPAYLSPRVVGSGSLVAGCTVEFCVGLWDADGVGVIIRQPAALGAEGTGNVLEASLTSVLDGVAGLDLSRLGLP